MGAFTLGLIAWSKPNFDWSPASSVPTGLCSNNWFCVPNCGLRHHSCSCLPLLLGNNYTGEDGEMDGYCCLLASLLYFGFWKFGCVSKAQHGTTSASICQENNAKVQKGSLNFGRNYIEVLSACSVSVRFVRKVSEKTRKYTVWPVWPSSIVVHFHG